MLILLSFSKNTIGYGHLHDKAPLFSMERIDIYYYSKLQFRFQPFAVDLSYKKRSSWTV